MGTGRRSLFDNYIFRKHSQKYPGKSLNFAENPLENPGKEFHFTIGHPGSELKGKCYAKNSSHFFAAKHWSKTPL